jgi:hypothetical protein
MCLFMYVRASECVCVYVRMRVYLCASVYVCLHLFIYVCLIGVFVQVCVSFVKGRGTEVRWALRKDNAKLSADSSRIQIHRDNYPMRSPLLRSEPHQFMEKSVTGCSAHRRQAGRSAIMPRLPSPP